MLDIHSAVQALLAEEVLILPTDTLYGFAALARNSNAVKKVFALKNRPLSKQLPVHYSSIMSVMEDCVVSKEALFLMEKFWPGQLTMVLPLLPTSSLVCVHDSVAVRIPNSPVLLQILDLIRQPLVMPSANFGGSQNLLIFDEIFKLFNLPGIKDDALLKGEPSTIVSLLDGSLKIIRQGVLKI